MNRLHTLVPLCLFAACSVDTDAGTYPAIQRPERESLLAKLDRLDNHELRTEQEGAFAMRSAGYSGGRGPASAGPGGPPGSAAAAAVSRPAGVARGGPRGLTTSGRSVAIGSDAFYMGTGRPGDAAPPEGAGGPPVLRAGATDDNVHFDEFLAYLDRSRAEPRLQAHYVDLDVSGRSLLRVVDATGAPVPGIELRVVDDEGKQILWRGTTYGDGGVPFYPEVARKDGGNGGPYIIEVPVGERVVRHPWLGSNDTVVRLPRPSADAVVTLDVALVIDTTGSMSDEIAAIKATLLNLTARLRELSREFTLRYAAVLYRDVGDKYVTATHDFTHDIEAFDKALQEIDAAGGGDGPESLNQALAVAVDGLGWRDGAARVAFVIADAPPHLDYEGDVDYDRSLRAAVARGIRMHTVAASGIGQAGSLVFRQIAQFTRGEFVFLEYGGNVRESADEHGVSAPVTGNNLDEILFTHIRDEIANWGRSRTDAIAASR